MGKPRNESYKTSINLCYGILQAGTKVSWSLVSAPRDTHGQITGFLEITSSLCRK